MGPLHQTGLIGHGVVWFGLITPIPLSLVINIIISNENYGKLVLQILTKQFNNLTTSIPEINIGLSTIVFFQRFQVLMFYKLN